MKKGSNPPPTFEKPPPPPAPPGRGKRADTTKFISKNFVINQDVIVEDKAVIEIDWDHKLVGISTQPMDFAAPANRAIETSNAQIIAQLASKYAYDLMQLPPEELRNRHLRFLSGL